MYITKLAWDFVPRKQLMILKLLDKCKINIVNKVINEQLLLAGVEFINNK